MARRSAPFARMALDYPDHPKIAGLSDAAFRAHVEMILYARKYKTDGLIPKRIAKRFASAALSELLTNDDERPSLTQDGDGDYWLHDFAAWQETREEIDAKSQVNKVAGTKGAQKRWRNAKRNDSDSPSKTDSESIAEEETEEEIKDMSTRGVDVSAEFDQFWELYPRKDGKKRARDRFVAARKRASLEAILDGVRRYCTALPTDRSKIKMAEGWLSGDRWDDPAPVVAIRPGETGIAGGDVQQLAGGVTLQVVNGTRWYRAPDGRTWAE